MRYNNRMAKRITRDTEMALVEAYRNGDQGGHLLAKRFGVGATTLYRALKRNGIAIDPDKVRTAPEKRFKLSATQQRTIADLYVAGTRPRELARRYKCSMWTIREAVKRQGVTMLLRGGQTRLWPKDVVASVVARYAAGESQEKIAGSLKTDQSTISHVLRNAGVTTSGPRREKHPMWSGGRVKTGSSIAVLIERDDPLSSMRMVTGYVLEHRLVMARHIGRPLTESETVHHINGNRTDNRIENLELRVGKHGRGVRMVCADCGSHNVRAVELSK